MGILYLDEAGNTGLKDKEQPLLIYGGPYVNVSEWKNLNRELTVIQNKYFSIITSRFKSGLGAGKDISKFYTDISKNVGFLQNFHFHAKDIINRKGLWSKLDNIERFTVLEEILDILLKHKVSVFIGALDKSKYLQGSKRRKMEEYYFLHENFLGFLENKVSQDDQIITVIEDGDESEKIILKKCLNAPSRKKFYGELICGNAKDYPILQIADVVIWIFQAFHRLTEDREDEHANHVRKLYKKVENITEVNMC